MTDAAVRARELDEALRLVRQDLESKATDLERLTNRETDLVVILADLTTGRDDLERRLTATEAAFEDAGKRATRERLAASKKAAAREAELDGQIEQERARAPPLNWRSRPPTRRRATRNNATTPRWPQRPTSSLSAKRNSIASIADGGRSRPHHAAAE